MADQDWTQPATSDAPESLWPALHDGTLLAMASDRLARTLNLTVELGFPKPAETYPRTVRLAFAGVSHALAFVARYWPGPAPEVVTPITDEMREASERYIRLGRAESIGLETLVSALEDQPQPDIIEASLVRTTDAVALTLEGYGFGILEDWWRVQIGAESLDVLREDGSSLGLDQLMRLGQTGWDEWSNRNKTG